MPIDRQLVRARWAVGAVFFLNGAMLGGLIPYFPVVQGALHMSDQDLGLSLLFSPMGALLSAPWVGRLIAKFGSKTLVLALGILIAAVVPLALAAPSVWSFRACLLAFGMANSTQDVCMNAQAVTIQHTYPRPMISSTHGFWSFGGFVAGGAVSLAAHLRQSPVIHALFADAILLTATVYACGKLLPRSAESTEAEPALALPRGPLLMLGLLTCLAFAAEGAAFDWSAVYFRTSLKTSQELAAIGFASFAVAMSIGRVTGDWVVHRLGHVRVMQLGSLASAAGMILAVSVPSPVVSSLGFVICGLGLSNVVPILFQAAGSVEGVSTGTGIAAVCTCGYVAFFVSPPAIGFVADRFSLGAALAGVGMLILVVGAIGPRAVLRARVRPATSSELPLISP